MFFLPELYVFRWKWVQASTNPLPSRGHLGKPIWWVKASMMPPCVTCGKGIPSRHLSHYTIACFAFAFPMGCHGRCNISDQLMLKKKFLFQHIMATRLSSKAFRWCKSSESSLELPESRGLTFTPGNKTYHTQTYIQTTSLGSKF